MPEHSSESTAGFCDTPLWDAAQWTSSSSLLLTECFQQTVLVYVPCGWLWLASIGHLRYVFGRLSLEPVSESLLNLTKMALCLLLTSLTVAEGLLLRHEPPSSPTNTTTTTTTTSCTNTTPVSGISTTLSGQLMTMSGQGHTGVPVAHYVAVSLKATTFLYAAVLIRVSRKALIASPCVLFIFWTLTVAAHGVALYSVLVDQTLSIGDRGFLLPCVTLAVLCLQLMLHCWAETSLMHYQHLQADKDPNPEVYASFPSKITFHWMNSLIYKGFRYTLAMSDIWDLPSQCKGQAVISKFSDTVDKYSRTVFTTVKTVKRTHDPKPVSKSRHNSQAALHPQLVAGETSPLLHKGPPETTRGGSGGGGSGGDEGDASSGGKATVRSSKIIPVFRCLVRTFYREWVFCVSIRAVSDCLQFLNPLLLDALISYTGHRDRYRPWQGYLLVVGFFLVSFLVSIFQNQSFYLANNMGMKVKTALVATVYRKALTMNSQAHRQFSTGAIVNFMAVDCQKMQTVSAQLWVLLSAPLQIGLTFYFLSVKLGASCLVGVAILFVLVPLNLRVSVAARQYQASQLLLKDQRLRMMNELLSGIKVIKVSAWEKSFLRRVTAIRDEEVRCLKKIAMFTTVSVFNWICSPILMTMGTLLTYALVWERGSLDASSAFVALSLFNIIKQPLNTLPQCISELVQSNVSLKRLREFLSCDDLKPSDVGHNAEDGAAIIVKNATFTWDYHLPPALTRLQLEVTEGQLVAVVGPVGSGKSSLLAAILGEMLKVKGSVALRGRAAYVPQQAWIQNRSLRDCVLFENPLEPKRYRKVVRACALQPDIDALPAGDATEIGEKGVNLSGGQKLRVTLARAVYQNADVYLLDDPLSAVDSRVGKHIFRKVISATGMLRNKTRVMVTHGIHWLPMCDRIVVMDNSSILQTGTYEQLLKHDGPFAQFLKTYLRQDTDDLDPEIQKILSQMHVRVENITSDGMTSADEDNYGRRKKSTRPREREEEVEEVLSVLRRHDFRGQLVQEEKSQTGQIKGFVLKQLLQAFGAGAAAATLVLLLLYNALGIAANVYLSRWTDDALLRNTSLADTAAFRDRLLVYVGLYSTLGALQAVLTFVFVGIIYLNMITASKHLHSNMLDNILHQPMKFFDTNPVGRILNRFSRDVDAVDGSMAKLVRMFTTQVFTVASVMVVISYSTPLFLTASLPLVFIYYLLQKFYIPCSRQLRRNESVSRSPVYSHFSETIHGAASIRAFGVTRRFRSESERLVDQNNAFFYAFISASRWLRIRVELLGNVIVVLSGLFAVLSRDVSASLVGLSVSYALRVTGALNQLVQNSTQLESNIVSVERMVEYITLPQEPPWVVKGYRPDARWPSKGVVRFHKFSCRYRPGLDMVLHSVCCTVHSGEKVGIVGRTGAGKSSLSLSLFRLLEAAEGSILIDGLNIASIGLHDLRPRLTILPQDPMLFSGTLRFNLDPLDCSTDQQLWAALDQAYLKTFVEDQPAGLDFHVEEGGLNLSVGQRQMVCLARALLRRTRLLILDEATSAVDLQRDELIQNTLRTAFNDCTVLTIAHRLHTVMEYDKIMVLEKGRITEMDSPDNLLADRSSVFYRMAQEAHLVP